MLGVDALVGMTPDQIAAHRRSLGRENLRRLLPQAARALRFDTSFRDAFSGSAVGRGFQFFRPWLPKGLVAKLKGESGPSGADAGSGLGTPSVPAETRPLILPPAFMVRRLAAQTEFSCRKAEQLLGYRSDFDLARGMGLTEQWARWARLLPEQVRQ
jgi:hypothetical protein